MDDGLSPEGERVTNSKGCNIVGLKVGEEKKENWLIAL